MQQIEKIPGLKAAYLLKYFLRKKSISEIQTQSRVLSLTIE